MRRLASCQQVMQGSGQSIQIGTGIGIALILFWWGIAWRAKGRGLFALSITRDLGAGNTKIHHHGLARGADMNVGRLDVAMDDLLVMRESKRLR